MDWDKKILLVYITSITFLVFSGRLLVPTLTGNIENSLDINHVEIGLGMTLLWLFYGLMQFPSGIISDEKGRKPVVSFAIFIFSIAFLIMSLSTNYFLFLISLILLGMGFGCFYTAGLSMISDSFKNKGKAIGIQSAMASLAGITPLITLPLVEKIGWRPLILIYAVTSIIIGILFDNQVSEKKQETQHRKEGLQNGVKIFKESNVTLLLIINAIMAFVWVGIISFLPIYLIEGKGIDQTVAAIIFSLIFFTGLFIRPLIGHLSDIYNKRILIVGILIISAIACFLLSQSSSIILTTIGVILTATISAFFPLRSNYLMNKWPSKSRGSKMGMYSTVVIILSSISPFIIGLSLKSYSFDKIFQFFSVIILFAIFLVICIKYILPIAQTKINKC
jgi:MFS transporter, YNFM family, putative membrane transport protein